MSAPKAIFARLKTESGVVAVCRNVFAADCEEGTTFPRIVFEIEDDERPRTYQGSSGVLKTTAKIDCTATTYKAAHDIGQAVKTALDNQSGTWGGVKACAFYRGANEEHDQPQPGTGKDTYTRTLQFDVWVQD